MLKGFLLIAIVFFMAFTFPAFGQSEFDVLPEEGRNALFHDYLMNEVNRLSDLRKAEIDSLLDFPNALRAKQAELRENYRMLLGDVPEKTPLNPALTGTIDAEGYYIEKIVFESRPNHHVTANFYIPDGDGPFPAVLVLCGHYPQGKADVLLQSVCINFATHGIAALIVDPISQGERNQIFNPATGDLAFRGQSGTAAHSRLDVGAVMNGTSVSAHSLWDNHRAMDYLYGRTDVVDTSRVGCTGSSGGGSQATFLTAFDDRIKVAAVNSFIMNEPTLFATIGPQTASQNLSYEGYYRIDHPSYITMFAPKPFMILCATQDFFDIEGTRETHAEMQKIYAALGVPENLGYFEYNDSHGYSQPKREAAVKWFRTWFYGDTASVTEPTHRPLRWSELYVTEAAQVTSEYADEKTVTDINVALANSLAEKRAAFWAENSRDSCLAKVHELLRMQAFELPVAEVVETIDRDNSTIDKLKITSGEDVPVTGLLFKPKNTTGKRAAVLYVDGRGKRVDAKEGGYIASNFVDSTKIVLSIDVRGFGETADNPSKNESKHGNREHRNAVISAYTGKTLAGQRVEDIEKALAILLARDDVDPDQIAIVGVDRAASAVLHAAALNATFKKVTIRKDTVTTLIGIVASPTILDNMTHVVPGALQFYDYPDLVNAIAPRTVTYTDVSTNTSVGDEPLQGTRNFELHPNYPNPFNPSTEISYSLSETMDVSLKIFNSNGQIVKTLVQNKTQIAGTHRLKWNSTDANGNAVASGVYFYQIKTPAMTKTKRMLLVR